MSANRTIAAGLARMLRRLPMMFLFNSKKHHDRELGRIFYALRRTRKDPDYYDAKWTKSKPSRHSAHLRDQANPESFIGTSGKAPSRTKTAQYKQWPPPSLSLSTNGSWRENYHSAIGTQDKPPSCAPSRHHPVPTSRPLPPPLSSPSSPSYDSVRESVQENVSLTVDNRKKVNIDTKILDSKDIDADTWHKLCVNLQSIRDQKEILLSDARKHSHELDRLDELEERNCMRLFSAYVSISLELPYKERTFDKDAFDAEMEHCFGSLDRKGTGEFRLDDETTLYLPHSASQIFSLYLSRKIWVPCGWKKYLSSANKFYDRVVRNPITRPVDETASSIALKILEAIMEGQDESEFVEREYSPDGACLENGKSTGGKRAAALFGLRSDKDHVVMVPIYTGGKIRCITVDSVNNCKFIAVNKFLGHCFRRLPCSVFGGDVGEWFSRCKFPMGEFVSGDLESATDNFDGRITDRLLDRFCELSDYEWDAQEMKACTTQCRFKVGKDMYSQTRGQMMGSVLSFPFLCILSLTAALFTKGDQWIENFIHLNPKEAFKKLRKIRDLGINGDDVAFVDNQGGKKTERWVRGVEAIGGVVSRGKSLRNPSFFTINSELWSRQGKVNCLRPSLVTALTGRNRYYISAAREWKEYRSARWVSKEARKVFCLIERLNLDIPVSLGGLGLVKKFRPDRFIHFWRITQARKSQPKFMFTSRRGKVEDEEREGAYFAYREALEEDDREKMTMYISRNMKKALGTAHSRATRFVMSIQEIEKVAQKLPDPVTIYGDLPMSVIDNFDTYMAWNFSDAYRRTYWPWSREKMEEEYLMRMDGYVPKRVFRGLANVVQNAGHAEHYDPEQAEDLPENDVRSRRFN